MAVTIPVPITPLPAAPSSADAEATFATKADAFQAAEVVAVPQINAIAQACYNNALEAYNSAVGAVNAPGSSATSTTSLSIGLGAKSLTIQTGKGFVVGQSVKIAYTTAPGNWMLGDVTAHNTGTGALDVNVTSINGSGGPFTAWTIGLSGPQAAVGLQTISTPADGMRGRITNGARFRIAETGTNKNLERALWFSNSVTEYAQFSIVMPKSWDRGTISFRPWWIADSGSGGVVWALQAVAVGDGDARDVAYGTAQVSIDTFVSAAQPHVGPEPGTPVTVAGSPAVGDKLLIQIYRDQAHASDTLAVEAGLTDIVLTYSTNAPNDA